MAEKWSEAYTDLKEYIAEHPEIVIRRSMVIIKDDIRPEFYQYFDRVRSSFIEEYYAAELDVAHELAGAFSEIRKSVCQVLHLDTIGVCADLEGFMEQPLMSFMSVLYSPLFHLLDGRIDENGFILEAQKTVEMFFGSLFCEGYERWGTLALLQLLEPQNFLVGQPRDLEVDNDNPSDFYPGNVIGDVPELQQENHLEFNYIKKATFLLPWLIVHSNRINLFASFTPRRYITRWTARSMNENLEWMDMRQVEDSFGTNTPDMMIHLAKENPDELKLLADYKNIARPDIVIDFVENDDWYSSQYIENILRYSNTLKPRLGTFIVSRVIVPPEEFVPLEPEPVEEPQPIVAQTIEELPLQDCSMAIDENKTDITTTSSTQTGSESAMDETEGDKNTTSSALAEKATTSSAKPKHPCLRLSDLPDDIHVLSAGYDANALEPITQALGKWVEFMEQAAAQEEASKELQETEQVSASTEPQSEIQTSDSNEPQQNDAELGLSSTP